MVRVSPLHRHFTPTHLDHVAREMQVLGSPVLRAYRDPATGYWLAKEGTHRLRCALVLGVAPRLVAVPWWRSGKSLVRARHAAQQYGYLFPEVHLA